jgi:hypothetical protein
MLRSIALFTLALILAGCGATSSVTPTQPSAPAHNDAQNVYFSGYVLQSVAAIVLPDGRFFIPTATGVIIGQGTVIGSSFTGTYRDFAGASVQSGSLNATFVAGESFDATLTENGASTSFHAVALPAGSFNLATPASLANFSRHYFATIPGPCGLAAAVSASARTIAAQPVSGGNCTCAFTGALTPDADFNFYTVSLTFPAQGCPFQSQTLSGIAVFYNYLTPDGLMLPSFVIVPSTANAATAIIGSFDPNNPSGVP